MPGGGTLQDLPKHVLITSDALARSGTVLQRTNQDGRARVQICQPALQKYQQRRHAREDCKRATGYRNIGQVGELPDLGSGVQ